MEIKTQVDLVPYEYVMKCDKCEEGYMEYNALNAVVATYPPKYSHTCNKCGEKALFTKEYPYISWEKVGELMDPQPKIYEITAFQPGQYVIYVNGDKYELGRVKSLDKDGAWVAYHSGETGAKTRYDLLHPIVNDHLISRSTIGGEWFQYID